MTLAMRLAAKEDSELINKLHRLEIGIAAKAADDRVSVETFNAYLVSTMAEIHSIRIKLAPSW